MKDESRELKELREEVKAWRQIAKGEVPERMTAEQFAYMQGVINELSVVWRRC